MNIDAAGNVVAGVGGSNVWLNGVCLNMPPQSGSPVFYQSGIAFNRGDYPAIGFCDRNGLLLPDVAPLGASQLWSNGASHWLGFLQGGPNNGSRTDWGGFPNRAGLGMAPSGRAFLSLGSYPENPTGIAAYDPGSTRPALELPDITPFSGSFFAFDDTRWLWTNTALQLCASSAWPVPPVQVPGSVYNPKAVDCGVDVPWVLYTTQSGAGIAHAYGDASKGFVVDGLCWGWNGWSPAAGMLEMCFTGNAGETGPVSRVRVALSDAKPISPPPVIVPPFSGKTFTGSMFSSR